MLRRLLDAEAVANLFSLDIGTLQYHSDARGGTGRYQTGGLILTGHWTEAILIKPRIIVTGATGRTGSAAVTELLQAGYPSKPWYIERMPAVSVQGARGRDRGRSDDFFT